MQPCTLLIAISTYKPCTSVLYGIWKQNAMLCFLFSHKETETSLIPCFEATTLQQSVMGIARKENSLINKQGVTYLLEGIREELNLSLDEMAERVGVPKSSLYHYIKDGASLPKPEVAAKICKGYGISFEDLARAAGYPVGEVEISEEQKRRIIKETRLEEWLSLNYSLNEKEIRSIVSVISGMVDIAGLRREEKR